MENGFFSNDIRAAIRPNEGQPKKGNLVGVKYNGYFGAILMNE
jgi:hypothetical protein